MRSHACVSQSVTHLRMTEHKIVSVKNDSEPNNILYEFFLPSFRSGYVQVEEDGYLLPTDYTKYSKSLDRFQIKNSDCIVASHPKTGTTWTQEMVWMIATNLDFNGGKTLLPDRFPFLEVSSLFDFTTMMENNDKFNPPENILDSVGFVNKLQDPRFIKTHLPWPLLPNQIQSGEKEPKIIYVARNPKDTCVSYYYHCRLIEGYTGNFEDFTKLFLTGKVSFGPFWKNVLSFWNQRHRKNLLFLTYEELKKDLPSVIRRVADFLGKTLTSDQVDILTKHLSFESMKQNPSVNYEVILDMNREFNITEDQGKFMRSGKVGAYKADMTEEIIAKFDEWTKENLKGINFPFPELIA